MASTITTTLIFSFFSPNYYSIKVLAKLNLPHNYSKATSLTTISISLFSMDSGSLQSSSGGDDEYVTNSHLALPPVFEPLPNFFIESDPKPDFNSLLFDPFSPVPDTNNMVTTIVADSPPQPRNPRKRSRASRRAPTTVLTTDTSNFRAMVQEFTGFPAPPFSSSPLARARLDLFGTGSGPSDVILRPFAQRYFQNHPQGSGIMRNDQVFAFQSMLNQPHNINDQSQLRGNMPNLVSNEGNLELLEEEKGATTRKVMEPWLCSSVNR